MELTKTSKVCLSIIILMVLYFCFNIYKRSCYERNYKSYMCTGESCQGFVSDDRGCALHLDCDADLIYMIRSPQYRRANKDEKQCLIAHWAENRWHREAGRCIDYGFFFLLIYSIVVLCMELKRKPYLSDFMRSDKSNSWIRDDSLNTNSSLDKLIIPTQSTVQSTTHNEQPKNHITKTSSNLSCRFRMDKVRDMKKLDNYRKVKACQSLWDDEPETVTISIIFLILVIVFSAVIFIAHIEH